MNNQKRVLVTGGSTGIGKSIVGCLVRDGYDVDFTFNKTPPSWMEDLSERSESVRALRCDLSRREDVSKILEDIQNMEAGYYAVVHNAGIAYDRLLAHVKVDRARELFDINFWSFVEICKAALPSMIRKRDGRILAISSIAAQHGTRGNAIYAASKAAIQGFAKSLTAEVAPRGITVNYISPGFVNTEMMKPYEKEFSSLTTRIPCRRFAEPDDVAACVRYLLSDGARYVNGAELVVDGGVSATIHG